MVLAFTIYPIFDNLLITIVAEEHRNGWIFVACTIREAWFVFHVASVMMLTLQCQVIFFESILEYYNNIQTGALNGYGCHTGAHIKVC